MFTYGTQVNPSLLRQDFSPLLQAAQAQAQATQQAAAIRAQSMANIGSTIGNAIQTYVQKKEEKEKRKGSIDFISRVFQSNPNLAKTFQLPLDEKGAPDPKALGSILDNFKTPEEAIRSFMALNEFAEQGKARQQQEQAASYAAMLRQGGGQVPSPISSQALAQFSPQARMAGEAAFLATEQARANVARTKAQTQKDLAPAAADLTAAQRDTEAIIAAEIASGQLNPNDRQALSKRRSELLALGGRGERQTERFQSPTAIVDASGNYLGQGVFDQKTGKFGLMNEETGQIEKLPAGAKPSTVSGMSRAMLAGPQFLKLRDDLGQAEVALNRLSAYMSSVENSRQGFEKLADKFATNFKTLLNSGALTKEQLATAASTGQLQSLLGANRLEMLGGGVLTENDALRIIAAAGGDVNALQNKEIVQEAIARMYNDKYRTYQRNREDYNIQVKGGYGGQGYAEAEKVEFDPRFLKDAAPAATAQVKQGTLSEIRARIEALKKKAGGTK